MKTKICHFLFYFKNYKKNNCHLLQGSNLDFQNVGKTTFSFTDLPKLPVYTIHRWSPFRWWSFFLHNNTLNRTDERDYNFGLRGFCGETYFANHVADQVVEEEGHLALGEEHILNWIDMEEHACSRCWRSRFVSRCLLICIWIGFRWGTDLDMDRSMIMCFLQIKLFWSYLKTVFYFYFYWFPGSWCLFWRFCKVHNSNICIQL